MPNTVNPTLTTVNTTPSAAQQIVLHRLPDVLKIIPVSKSAWWAGIAAGIYPPGIKLSQRCTAWRSDDIQDLIVRLTTSPVRG